MAGKVALIWIIIATPRSRVAGREWPDQQFHAMLAAQPKWEGGHAFRRIYVLHRLFDECTGARQGAGRARLRVTLGCRAFAHSGLAQDSLLRRRRPAEALL